ncbi:hypothetical protein OJAV_G00233110 [Oryzias javanicus]|uniref:Uncharacterized protein n=1 Tax=Oryzias javanicus TaxID=123683 RepID=A0A3S2PMZ1_ORYJA|nr:hypothetical protein OJAV_G00233110 [Oryzias javanicus]
MVTRQNLPQHPKEAPSERGLVCLAAQSPSVAGEPKTGSGFVKDRERLCAEQCSQAINLSSPHWQPNSDL